MEKDFKKAVLVKSILFLLIVFWGGYNSTVMNNHSQSEHISAFKIHSANRLDLEKRAANRGVLINNYIHLGGVDFLLVE